jgi:hypothetical protein
MESRTAPGPDAVADAQWARVRALGARVAELEAQDAAEPLDEEDRARLERARTRAARAAQRALLADALADRLAAVRPPRR